MKRLFPLLLAFLLFTPLTAHAAEEEILYYFTQEDLSTSLSALSLTQSGVFDPADPTYGAQLTDPVAVTAYNALVDQMSPTVAEIKFSITDFDPALVNEYSSAAGAALSAYLFDHPETQYFDTYSIRMGFSYSGSRATCTYYIVQLADSKSRQAQLEEIVEHFVDSLSPALTDLETYQAIHDYVWALANYDLTAPNAHSAYGLLLDGGAAVCEGYSKAFKILCDAAGLPCMLISGESTPGSGSIDHMWNAVCLDGKWYSVDVTWDDPITPSIPSAPDLSVNVLKYTYFLNNAYFTDGDPLQDHRGVGNISSGADDFVFALPPLSADNFGELPCDTLSLTVMGDYLSIPDSIFNYIIGGVHLRPLPNRVITLTRDTYVDSPVLVDAGRTYTLNTHSNQFTLSRASGYADPIFQISGTLNYYGDVADPTVFSIASTGVVNIHGDVSVPRLTVTSGTMNVTGKVSGCVVCQGGTANINGTPVTGALHRADGNGCVCGDTDHVHTYGENPDEAYLNTPASCTAAATYFKSCSLCGHVSEETFSYGSTIPHAYSSDWSSDAANHWHACSCGAVTDSAPHLDVNGDLLCDTCGSAMAYESSAILAVSGSSVTFKAGSGVTRVYLCVASYSGVQMTGVSFKPIDTIPGQTVETPIAVPSGCRVFLLGSAYSPLCPIFPA